MLDFVEEIDELFSRKIEKLSDTERARREAIPIDVMSLDQLKTQMIDRVWKSNLSEAQKRHTENNIKEYLAEGLWEESKQFQPTRISKVTLDFLPEDYERREIEARRVKTSVKKGRFVETLSRFKEPIRRREVSEQVASVFKLSPSTISRDLTPMFKAGYLERISWGVYKLTSLGEDMLKGL